TPFAGQAHLYLADATMKNKFYDEAQRIYMKVYHLGFSPELQAAAALGAAKCLYEKKDYQEAEQWVNKYMGLAKDHKSRDVYDAYFLLGKINIALGKPQEACEALQYTLSAKHSPQEYTYIVSALAGSYIEQERFVEALELLAGIPSWQLSQEDAVNVLLLQSKVTRQMGLVDNAVTTLNDRGEYISDAQLKAKISLELADCYIAKGNFELAQKSLTEVLVLAEPGSLTDQAKLALADVYLKLEENSQAVSICSQILESQAATQIKQKAAELIAFAYAQEKDYDKAALVLLGKWTVAPAKQE
ncbi:MAG: tetratricopeptide repeat protein, partial [Planctomycetota bacterium]|nr:tetratricopeptide repeat protein [Planctomycetota bacterium]